MRVRESFLSRAADQPSVSLSDRGSTGGVSSPGSARSSTSGPAVTRSPGQVDARPLAQSMSALAKPRPLSPLIVPKAAPAPALPRDTSTGSAAKEAAKSPSSDAQPANASPQQLSPRGPVSPDFGSLRRSQGAKAQIVTISAPVQVPRDSASMRRASVSGGPPPGGAPANPTHTATPTATATPAPSPTPIAPSGAGTVVTPSNPTPAVPASQAAVEESAKASRKGFDALSRLLASPSTLRPPPLSRYAVCDIFQALIRAWTSPLLLQPRPRPLPLRRTRSTRARAAWATSCVLLLQLLLHRHLQAVIQPLALPLRSPTLLLPALLPLLRRLRLASMLWLPLRFRLTASPAVPFASPPQRRRVCRHSA